jgi:hypothetical protein
MQRTLGAAVLCVDLSKASSAKSGALPFSKKYSAVDFTASNAVAN